MAATPQWLGGGSTSELMGGSNMARSTAYAAIDTTMNATIDSEILKRVKYPTRFPGAERPDVDKHCVCISSRQLAGPAT